MAGVRFDSFVFNQAGTPIQNAQISVCSGTTHAEIPCTPTTPVYSDEALTMVESQPISTGPLGNFGFYAAAADYSYSVTGPGITGVNYALTLGGGSGNPSSPSNSLQYNAGGSFGGSNISYNSGTGATTFAGPVTLSAEGVTGNVAIKPTAPIQFVAVNGNDSWDGLSMGTAKLTIMAAYDALPTSGGEIQILSNPANAQLGPACTSTTGQGIWLMGPADPNYSSPPPGWRKLKPVSFIGVARNMFSQQGHETVTSILCGNASVANQPGIWISSSSTSGSVHFENLLIQYPQIAVMIGVDSNGAQTANSGVVGISFDNIETNICNSCTSAIGPGWLLGGGDTFDIYIDNCVIAGNPNATPGSDNQAAILKKPISSTNQSVGFVFIENSVLVDGGIKSYGGSTTLDNLFVRNVYSESITAPAGGMGTVWFVGNNAQAATVIGVATADNAGAVSDVRNDITTFSLQHSSYISVTGANLVVGPMSIIGAPLFESLQTTSPLANNQTGFFNGRVVGHLDPTARTFGPSPVRYSNLAKTIASTWTTSGTGPTLTSAISAPDGTSGAGQLASTGLAQARFFDAAHAVAVGDTFVAGVWTRSTTSNGFVGGVQLISNLSGSNTYSCSRLDAPLPIGGGEWSWVWQLCTATAISVTPEPELIFAVNSDATHTIQAYGPVLLYVPANTITLSETFALANSLKSYSHICPPGVQCGMDTQVFAPTLYGTATNCTSAASPAVCAASAAGSVVVAAAATTVTVNTTAITANSQVLLTFDSSLGTKLGVTCNTTPVQGTVSARTAGTSFVITTPSAPSVNPACFSYSIIN